MEHKAVTDNSTPELRRDADIKKIIKDATKSFSPYVRSRIPEWSINIAYLMGYQYIGLDGAGHIVSNPPKSPHAVTANKILPAILNDMAMASKTPGKYDVIPDGTDDDDKATAIAGEKMAGYLGRINNLVSLRQKIMLWWDIANEAWVKVYWDPQHKVFGRDEQGNPVYLGETVIEHVPSNEVIYDWRGDMDKLTWIIHAKQMTYAEAKNTWDKAESIPSNEIKDPSASKGEFEIKIYQDFGKQFPPISVKPESEGMGPESKMVDVYEYWHVIDNDWSMGSYAVLAGDTVMVNQPYPIETYPHGKLPLIGYDLMPITKGMGGTASKVSQARPLQREYNDARTQILDNNITLGGGIWSVSRDAKVELKEITDGIGLIVEYSGTRAPKRESGVPIAGAFFAHLETIRQDLNELFAFHEVSKGQMPEGGPRSAIGIQVLQEADKSQTYPIIQRLERKDQDVMYQALTVSFANYNERNLNIVGKDNEWTLFKFDPQKFGGVEAADKFNVVVRSGSSSPLSKAAESDMAVQLWSSGLLGDPMSPDIRKKVLEIIDIGGMDTILKDNAKHVNFAQKEFLVPIEMFKQAGGIESLDEAENKDKALEQLYYVPPPNTFDNHDVHYIEHRNYLLDNYWQLLEKPEMITFAKAFLDHLEIHSQIIARQQLQQAIMSGQYKPEKEKPKKE